jgi:hypothetical protein
MPRTPVAGSTASLPVSSVPKRFHVTTTVNGWEVTDADGRSVSPERNDPGNLYDLADTLNSAAASGPQSLRRALGAAYEDDDELDFTDDDYEFVVPEMETSLWD